MDNAADSKRALKPMNIADSSLKWKEAQMSEKGLKISYPSQLVPDYSYDTLPDGVTMPEGVEYALSGHKKQEGMCLYDPQSEFELQIIPQMRLTARLGDGERTLEESQRSGLGEPYHVFKHNAYTVSCHLTSSASVVAVFFKEGDAVGGENYALQFGFEEGQFDHYKPRCIEIIKRVNKTNHQ